jgi:hypothetical protein
MNHGVIKKARVETGFTQIPNSIARDANLSSKEKGIMVCLLSLPDDWIIYKTQLHKFFADGRDGIINGFNSLIEKGYIQTERVHDTASGQFIGHNYIVSPIPSFPESAPITASPETANPKPAEPIPVNTVLRKKDSTKKNLTKKNVGDLSDDLSSLQLPFNEPEFTTAWDAWKKFRASEKKKLSVIAAAAQLKLLAKYDFMTAIEMIETSIRNQWQGIFELKTNFNNGRKINGNGGGGTQAQFATRHEKYKQLDNNP